MLTQDVFCDPNHANWKSVKIATVFVLQDDLRSLLQHGEPNPVAGRSNAVFLIRPFGSPVDHIKFLRTHKRMNENYGAIYTRRFKYDRD